MRKQTKLVAALSATALLAIGASAVTFAAGWNNSTGEWQYLDNDGNAVTDAWRKSGDYWFYLGSDGNMAKNEVVQNDNDYYFVNGDGAMVTNQWVSFDEATEDGNDKRWMYFGADGKAYRDRNDKLTISDIKEINGKKYLFDQEGKMLYGWLGDETALVNGDDAWTTAKYYYGGFDDGSAQHGWVQLTVNDNGEDSTAWFYFDDNGKISRDKKKTINGQTYYFDGQGRMIEDWSTATKASGSSFKDDPKASDNVVYVNGDGGARKNQWVWAVPADSYDKDDYENDKASWWYADNSGKIVKDKVKKIKGKVYAFDGIGRMVSGLVRSTDNGRRGFITSDKYQEMDGTAYTKLPIAGKVYYFSGDYEKDGSRKTGYQKVDFDDDTYEMYFNNNGEAANNYVSKIKKYAKNGIVLKANNDDSNYAGVEVNSSDVKELAAGSTGVNYYNGFGSLNNQVLVNTAGSVQASKTNLKDSNDIYYATDNHGVIKYCGDQKLYTVEGDRTNSITLNLGNGPKKFWY